MALGEFTHTHTHTHTHTQTYTDTHTQTYTQTDIHTDVHTHRHIPTHTHRHTHTHAHTLVGNGVPVLASSHWPLTALLFFSVPIPLTLTLDICVQKSPSSRTQDFSLPEKCSQRTVSRNPEQQWGLGLVVFWLTGSCKNTCFNPSFWSISRVSAGIPSAVSPLQVTERVCSDLITQVSVSSLRYMPHAPCVRLCTFL